MTRTSGIVLAEVFTKLPHFTTIDTEKSVVGVNCTEGRKTDNGRYFVLDVGPTWFGSPIARRKIAIFRSAEPKKLGKDYKYAGTIKIGLRPAHIFLQKA
jgi:hypothetical protein